MMPEDQKRPKRPRDVIGNAVRVMEIATGQREEECEPDMRGKEYARKGGLKGGRARAEKLTPERRRTIAKKAAKARWKDKEPSRG